MLNTSEIMATIKMIEEQKLDIRTITMGISLLDCIADSEDATCQKVYDRITRQAQNLVKVGEDIERHSHRQQAGFRHPGRPALRQYSKPG